MKELEVHHRAQDLSHGGLSLGAMLIGMMVVMVIMMIAMVRGAVIGVTSYPQAFGDKWFGVQFRQQY